MKQIILIIGLLSLLLLPSCNAQGSSGVSKLKELASQDLTLIVDVRTPQEFESGHYEKSVNIPLDLLPDSIDSLRRYKSIITICRSGNRSETAKKILNNKGFDNVYNGGGWRQFQSIINQ